MFCETRTEISMWLLYKVLVRHLPAFLYILFFESKHSLSASFLNLISAFERGLLSQLQTFPFFMPIETRKKRIIKYVTMVSGVQKMFSP